eukprot:6983074-Prymnesium_polylepis.1
MRLRRAESASVALPLAGTLLMPAATEPSTLIISSPLEAAPSDDEGGSAAGAPPSAPHAPALARTA